MKPCPSGSTLSDDKEGLRSDVSGPPKTFNIRDLVIWSVASISDPKGRVHKVSVAVSQDILG